MKILSLPGPKFAHPFMMKLFKRGTVKSAHGHGIGRHSEDEVKKIGLADLKVRTDIGGIVVSLFLRTVDTRIGCKVCAVKYYFHGAKVPHRIAFG